ncbi:type VI secretion system baseplate subunit TssG [Sphingomonas sp. DT-51]|uniref:type VI secretion system baseplate subunit TssG n=1 Tax=Sphingomonas sp. DT-51 TaxID=3396165 RepID=UPI003F1D6FCB
MARAPRPASDHLSYLERAAARVAGLSPLALLRGAEARAPALPLIGTSKLPANDVVAMIHTPTLTFPAATLDAITVDAGRATVAGQWLGLTGPMGPLPLHLTEYAADERRHARQRPYGRFLDVLAGRMLQLFYRAWASAVPAASLDRSDDDRFGGMIAALSGAQDGACADSVFPAPARLRYAALFAGPRSPAAIADALSDLLRLPVRVVEHVAQWRDVEPGDRTVLGGGFATLGRDALAGTRVFTLEDAFRIVVHVRTAREHRDLLPGGARFALLLEAADAFAPPHLDWALELAVASEAIRPARLGGSAQLGWSSWSAPVAPGRVRADARLGVNARRLARRIKQEIAA